MDGAHELAVLMAVRVHGRADAVAVARTAGVDEGTATATLAALRAAETVASAASPSSGAAVTLTDQGRARLVLLLASERHDAGKIAEVYDAFVVADRELKRAITAWQLADDVRKGEARDGVLAAATTAGGVAAVIGAIAPRFAPYAGRLAVAAGAIATGDARFVASPRVDSLHQIWFELHEDLLATLGRSRAA
ncbi:MAG: transcriptional regulator [Candidatus Binatia bacterium]